MTDSQRSLFDRQAAAWELDDAAQRLVATVVFRGGPPKPLDYLVPEPLCDEIQIGRRVHVPLGKGNREVTGYCVALETRAVEPARFKEITGLVDRRTLLSPALVRLTRWLAERYLCGWGQALEAVVPAGVRSEAGTRVATLLSVDPQSAAALDQLDLPPKQARIVRYLAASPVPITPQRLAMICKCTQAPIRALRERGILHSVRERMAQPAAAPIQASRESALELNEDQRLALNAILAPLRAGRHETILVHGVTGSGKTEVYIQAIEEVIRFGRQAIVLVPEISLTPQTQQRFRSRFDHVAVLHSHLSDSERHRHWQRIADGEVQVVVGARSAVFAPTPHLGLVVLDEEHETSFKQDSAPRYHAREVALWRAREEEVPLVLGSATPSLESWHRACQGTFRLVQMPRRVFNLPLPDVATVDLRGEYQSRRYRGAISGPLVRAMDEALRDGGQVILLLNRRGFSTHIQCPSCGAAIRCPDCDIALTHHRQGERAICHYCEYEIPSPQHCPECAFTGIRYGGVGTQKLEAEVRARFPGHTCLRMDTDTMQQHGSHERALARFRSGEVQILLGTQMIAKGLDFPNVTLVGVVNADLGLHLPDFRAAERTFQLVTQVAGRTGRGRRGGRVLVQTFTPEHPAIQAAVRHDYERFAACELPIRQGLGYPPWTAMVRLVIRGDDERAAAAFARELHHRLEAATQAVPSAVRLLGPAPAPLARLRGKFRFHLLALGEEGEALRQAVESATADVQPPDGVQWIADVDPVDML